MSLKAQIFESLQKNPLGTLGEEATLQAPYNISPVKLIVRVRNLSAIRERRYTVESISMRRGGQRFLTEGPGKGKGLTIETLRADHAQGQNVDWTEVGIKPVDARLMFDGKAYVIPHTDPETGEKAPWKVVPDGLIDLYYGNPDRMQSRDEKERSLEIERVMSRRKDVIVRGSNENDWAYLEFHVEKIMPTATAIDKERVYAGDVVEV